MTRKEGKGMDNERTRNGTTIYWLTQIIKKGEQKLSENYRSISLVQTSFKIYARIIDKETKRACRTKIKK